jgi:hypothetical protein
MINTQTPVINFLVPDLHDLYHLGIADASFYPTNFNVTEPTVEITPPAFPKATIAYTIKNLNSYNSNDVNISCVTDLSLIVPLPDGLWTVRMSIAPNTQYFVTKTFMRTTKIRRKFGLAVMKTDISNCGMDMKQQQQAYLDEIDYYIECATAAGNDCNGPVAMSLLRQANKMLDDFIDDKPNYRLDPGYYLAGL